MILTRILTLAWRVTQNRAVEELLRTAAHLLSNHDDTGRLGSASKSGDGEQFDESREHIPRFDESRFLDKRLLVHDLSVDIVQVSRSLERTVSKPKERFVGLVDLPFG